MKNSIHRRSFLKNTSALLAGMGLMLPQIKASLPSSKKKIELAIATICLDGFGDENFEHAFQLIPQIGLKNVEFNVWNPRNITLSGIAGIRDRCYERGLRPISLQGTSFGGNVIKDVGHKLWLMERTQELGCRIVKFTGSKRGTHGGLDNVIKVLRELAPAAEELDVLVTVENHANNNIENLEDYRRIFDAVDSTHVGMCLDIGHFAGAGVSNFDVIKEFHSKVMHVDLKDIQTFGTYKTVPMGEGICDLHGIIKALLEKAYQGFLVIEQAPPKENLDLLTEMKRIKTMFQAYEQ